MKKILTILLLISVAYAQDTTRSKINSKERLQIAAERDATAAKTDDSLRVRSKFSHKLERIGGLNGAYSIKELGVKPDGTDQTGNLLWGLAKSYVKELIVDDDTSSVFTFNTNFTLPADLRITFKNGCRFSGSASGNFNGSKISAADSQIFDTTFTASNVRGDDGFFHVRWYGATSGTSGQYKYFSMSQAATYPGQAVWVSKGSYQFNQTFQVTSSFVGEKGSVIKYNPSFAGTTMETLWQTNASSTKISGLEFDGSDKAGILLYVNDRNKNILVENSSFHNIEQLNSSATVEAIYFGSEVDGMVFDNLYINKCNAAITGNVCGIRGSGSVSGGTIAPQNVHIRNVVIDTVTNTGAGSNWDADGIRIQGYTTTASIHLSHIYLPNISKRGIKAQTDGIYIEYVWGNSYRYRSGNNSYSFISMYSNNSSASHVYVQGGSYEKTLEIGNVGSTWNNITLSNFQLNCSDSALLVGNNDGVRVYGTNNKDITIRDGYMQNVRHGVWLDCSDTATVISGVTIKRFTGYALNTDATSNSAPNDWHVGLNVTNNTARNSTGSAYLLFKISGGTFTGNGTANVSNYLFNYQPDLDSVIKFNAVGNYNATGSTCINYGNTSNRPLQSSSGALTGLMYYNTDSSFYQVWQGGSWVAVKQGAGGGSGITALTGDVTASGSGSVAATIASGAVTNTKVGTGIDAAKLADGSVSNTEFQYINSLTSNVQTQLSGKQATLVSGTNIKTVDGQSLVGSGDVDVSVAKNADRDSIIVTVGSNRYAVKDSVGSAGMTNPMTTSQDIIVGGSSGTPTRLAKGTDGQALEMYGGSVGWRTKITVDTGSYVPTVDTTGSQIASWTPNRAYWRRIGDQVHVWGSFIITTGSASTGAYYFTTDIPVAATFNDNVSLSGHGTQRGLGNLGSVSVWPYYIGSPVTVATISYTKTIGTAETFFINYSYDYIIPAD